MSTDPGYHYPERQIGQMSDRFFAIGQGRISGYVSSFLGIMNLLGMLAFKFPTWFTTADLRYEYNIDVLRLTLQACLVASLTFGTLTFVIGRRRVMGTIGIVATLTAIAIGGFAPEPGPVLRENAPSLGLDWLVLDLLGSAIVFVSIEKVWPRYVEQAVLRPYWKLDLAFFAMNHLTIGLLLFVGNHFAPAFFGWAVNQQLQDAMRSLPVAAQAVILVLAADFVQYWVHRSFHEVPFLWRFHAVHHSTLYMDWLAGSRTHFLEVLADRTLVLVPLWLLGPDEAALNVYVVIAGFQAVFIHANFGMDFGVLKQFVATPQFHHWHHSSEQPAIDTNYGVHVTLYDRLFGTYHLPSDKWPAHYGTVSPIPDSLPGQLLYPLLPPRWFEKGRDTANEPDASSPPR
jgi:sterol desaturase/sphingolipid hydroxylase (fatty acid hydroxylase superfamily)